VTALVARVRGVDIRDYGIVVAFVALFVSLTLASDKFFQRQNFANLLDQYAAVGLLTAGATLCIISGVFDLSAGAAVSVCGVTAATVANDASPEVGILAGIGAGLGLGIVNGLLIDFTRVNSFIGTLATGIVFGGVAIIITGGNIVTVEDLDFGYLGQEEVLGLKLTAWTFLGFAVITAFLLHRTTFGRYVYAAGGNPEAARLSGIRVGVVRGACFAISGLSAGLAGVLLASRTSSSAANLGMGLELQAIAAAVVGGTSIMGGEGAIWRGVLGVLLIGMIGNGFNLLGIETTYQQITQGGLILLAVASDQLLRRRR
jgi:ribose transport system permease protein